MTHALIVLAALVPAAFAINGADDSAVIPPGPPTARPVYAPPPSTAAPVPGPATQRVYQLPIDTAPPPAPQPSTDDSKSPSSSSNNPVSSLMPMLQGMGGGGRSSGDDRAAGSGDTGAGGAQAPSTGSSNALDIKGGAGQINGEAMTTVNGCAGGAGKFQLIYASDAKTQCSPGRDGALKISETLASFLDRNLNRCISSAAGTSISGGKLFHAGVIGDERHQTTGSLHNAGLAIDVNAIEAGGKIYSYADSSSKGFFTKLRDCWGKAAQAERLGCLQNSAKGFPPGSVGDEDSDHTKHLHLSVPPCPADAKSKGMYMARWVWLPPAAAAEAPKVRVERLGLAGGGRAELLIRDQRGEPVDADHRFTVRVRCGGGPAAADAEVIKDVGGCDFVSFGLVDGAIELRYLTSEMSGGVLICRRLEIKRIKATCPASSETTASKRSTPPAPIRGPRSGPALH